MESLPDPAAFLTRWNSVLSREAELCWSLPTVTLLHLMGLVVRADSSDPWRPTRFHLVILSEHDRLCVGSPRPGLVLKAQLSGTMVAKYYGHKNVTTKSKQKNRAYFWTIPFLVKYTGSKEK